MENCQEETVADTLSSFSIGILGVQNRSVERGNQRKIDELCCIEEIRRRLTTIEGLSPSKPIRERTPKVARLESDRLSSEFYHPSTPSSQHSPLSF